MIVIVLGRGREVRDESRGDRRKVRRGGEDRRVVGVVRRSEEDGLRGRLDRRERLLVAAADRRTPVGVARLHLVAVHQGQDRDRAGSGRRGRVLDEERLLVGRRAVPIPPGAVEGPAAERRRERAPVHERVPGGRGDLPDRASTDREPAGRVARRARPVSGGRGAGDGLDRRRTGGLCVQGAEGHDGEDITGSARSLSAQRSGHRHGRQGACTWLGERRGDGVPSQWRRKKYSGRG